MHYDWRNLKYGRRIPNEHYCDQPYVVITQDGGWLCTMTTGKGEEGAHDQHVVATVSKDNGQTWSPLIDIEPSGPPESSWVTPLIVPSGRVYAFYTYNADNIRELTDADELVKYRVDTIGDFAYKYSDDNGHTWSEQRYKIPVRLTQIDRSNADKGNVRYFWSVCKPIVHNNAVYIGLAKVGKFGLGFLETSEGFVVKSDNLLTEADPANIRWETLPDGEVGLKSPAGPIAEEHCVEGLNDGSLYCTYRTIEGYSCHAYSRDGGHTWTSPQYATYTPGGKKIKHPRAATFVWKTSGGKYVLWFHNYGVKWVEKGYGAENQWRPYDERNPVWLCGGVEKDGYIHWSQPEIALYDEDPGVRMSYPDLVEEDGRYYITETQKTVARVHDIDPSLFEAMWNQENNRTAADAGVVLRLSGAECGAGSAVSMPRLPSLSEGGGFAIDGWFRSSDWSAGQVLLDSRDADGIGLTLVTTDLGTVKLVMNDGRTESSWDCDPGTIGEDRWHHIAVIVDGGPKIMTFVVDGVLCDGGERRPYGWGRFNKHLKDVSGGVKLRIASSFAGQIDCLRMYNRYLRTSEAIGNYRAGK